MTFNFTRDLMLAERIVCCFCIYTKNYKKKKENLRKSGYIVDKPKDFKIDKYSSTRTHGFWDVKVYTKYGLTSYLEEDGKYTLSDFI